MDKPDQAQLAAQYLRFAEEEARGRSPLYAELAQGVAEDPAALGFLLSLPPEKRQPNLLFAAVRHLNGTPNDWWQVRLMLAENPDALRAAMLARSTQTNEPARCAVLLPLLASLPQPLALVEVGASAGLCLLPDRYAYDYGTGTIHGEAAGPDAPVFTCTVNADTPLPTGVPTIAWRAGLDLNPLDLSDPEQAAWLETLVWPEQSARLANLRKAIGIAGRLKPRVVKGDLRNDLARLCREAPDHATLVIFHTAVLSYVTSQAERESFAELAGSLCRYWIANESPRVFPEIAKQAGAPIAPGRFLLSLNGSPLAWTDPHGQALEWLAGTAY